MAATVSAKDLVQQGLRPAHPHDVLRREVLARLDRSAREGVTGEEAWQELFPSSLQDPPVLRNAVAALVAGSNLLLLGPTGSGKTNLAKDVWDLYPKDALAVEGCPVQDDPFSLADPAFARVVPPCPWCRMTHGESDLKDVPVRRVRLREGHGLARIQGSPEVFPDYLTGSLNLAKLEEIGDPESPLVLEPGKVMQAHRGVLIVDEIGKLPRGTQNVLLQALQESIVSPAKTRETFPAAFVAVTTSNLEDLDHITEPLVGRLSGVYVGFSQDHARNRRIVDLGLASGGAWVASPLRDAAVDLLLRWRRATEDVSDLAEVGSNRTLIDVVRRAESHATLAGRRAATMEDLRAGALDAMLGRVRARSPDGFRANRDVVEGFLRKNWAEAARDGAEVAWCRFFVDELKEDKSEAQRTAQEASAWLAGREGPLALDAMPAKLRRFAEWVGRAEGPGAPPAAEAAAVVFRAIEAAGVFEAKK